MNSTTNHTGISTEEFTLPDGRELPPFNIETEGWELVVWLMEIDKAMNRVSWDAHGDRHSEWYSAWTAEFFRIRKALGVFDPYSSEI